ncbi:MAG: preprotein translocase subunit SecE [Candidatus Yanofskybacteria bacterium]|nr:preprotein translocase subunit SecE [Candidatus Yanofskybacteria bacterium]
MNGIINFLKDVRVELSKVSWPTRSELIRYTLAVIGVSLTLAVFLGLLDGGFSYLVNRFFAQ